jgi:hypothetical protein
MLRRSLWHFTPRAVSSYRLEEVLAQAGQNDPVIATWKGQGFSYATWPDRDPLDLRNHLLRLPLFDRGIHTVFGRPDIPVDIGIDLDSPAPALARDGSKTLASLPAFTTDVVNAVVAAIDEQCTAIDAKVTQRYVMHAVYPSKMSVHIYARLHDAAFADYTHLNEFVKRVADSASVPGATPEYNAAVRKCVDRNVYRLNGSLRLFGAVNRNKQSPLHIVAKDAKDPDRKHWQMGPTDAVTLLDASLMIRPPLEVDRLIELAVSEAPLGLQPGSKTDPMSPSSDFWTKWRIEPVDGPTKVRAMCEGLRLLPPELAEEYRDWSIVYLQVRSFLGGAAALKVDAVAAERDLLLAFHDFSKLAAHKYREQDVNRKWRSPVRGSGVQGDPDRSLLYVLRRAIKVPPSVAHLTMVV